MLKYVEEVLDESYSQLTLLSGVAVQARRQSTQAGTASILCTLVGWYGYSAELAQLSKVRLKLPQLVYSFRQRLPFYVSDFVDGFLGEKEGDFGIQSMKKSGKCAQIGV